MVYYFNAKEGMRTLVESLEFNREGLPLIQSLLEKEQKLQEDFQRKKLYEWMIDFLHRSNQDVEGKNLSHKDIH